ncbi:peptidoglycan bridge formation glycyltransferase FemA/FemB family protein [Patescibacteria group bacterium]|nr:peptidoglycan bridge formation glycyltransferase FemA/FemB family protein [Patescibacteria group bacterium]MBU4023001.1 peptidoglycan bridge formation glycyltransferase FemA/FemB family protein [Patescibacteria group bacterium]MBU4162199.1 peptidoglycan bridge formation glycyltransferase FemA/FemB family protein [Patescibacteria group bacterium]
MIKEIDNRIEWEGFLKECKEKTFLHSWNWGEFQKLMGSRIWRLGIYQDSSLLAIFSASIVRAKRGSFLLVEHGPIINPKAESQKPKILEEILEYLKELGKKEKVGFTRVCPIWERTEENEKAFKELGFRDAQIHIRPEVSWVLNIDKSEDELLRDMRKTTRYLIRQAGNNPDIEIIKSVNPFDVEIFNNIYQQTGERAHFVPFSLNYLKKEFESFLKNDQALLFLGKYKGEVVAGAMIIFWQDSAFYHQGASLRKYAKIPVSYLLQWEAIKEAKTRGLKEYSFWGIASNNKTNHPWKGLTLFKQGFGGERKEYVKTQDYIISSKYWLNYIVEKVRKKKRGF